MKFSPLTIRKMEDCSCTVPSWIKNLLWKSYSEKTGKCYGKKHQVLIKTQPEIVNLQALLKASKCMGFYLMHHIYYKGWRYSLMLLIISFHLSLFVFFFPFYNFNFLCAINNLFSFLFYFFFVRPNDRAWALCLINILNEAKRSRVAYRKNIFFFLLFILHNPQFFPRMTKKKWEKI